MSIDTGNPALRSDAPTDEEWHQIWLDHPDGEPGLTEAQSSYTYTSRGLDARNARLAGSRGIITMIGPDSRIRGAGKGGTIDLVNTWKDELKDELKDETLETAVAQLLDDLPRGRLRRLAMLSIRQGQPQFRARLMAAYQNHCAISGCDVPQVLQAAHIEPYDGPATNVVTNGLLLRADLHDLFDADLLWIEPGYVVRVAAELRSGDYGRYDNRPLRLPANKAEHPSLDALIARRPGTA